MAQNNPDPWGIVGEDQVSDNSLTGNTDNTDQWAPVGKDQAADNQVHSVLSNIGDEFSSGLNSMGNAYKDLTSKDTWTDAAHPHRASDDVGSYLSGAAKAAFSPLTGAAKYVGDKTAAGLGLNPNDRQINLSQDDLGTTAKKFGAGVAENLAAIFGPEAVSGVVGKGAEAGIRAVTPELSPQAKLLQDQGLTLTPGQLGGPTSQIRSAEKGIGAQPFIGPMVADAKSGVLNDFRNRLYNDSLGEVGENLPSHLKDSTAFEKNDYVKSLLNSNYDRLKPQITYSPGDQVFSDLINVPSNFKFVTQDTKARYDQYLTDYINEVAANNGTLNGEAFKSLDSNLGQDAVQLLGKDDNEANKLGAMLNKAKSILRDDMAVQNPKIAPALQANNRAYSKYMDTAASSIRRVNANGEFTPSDYLSVLKSKNPSGYEVGDASEMQPFANAAVQQGVTAPTEANMAHQVNFGNVFRHPGAAVRGLVSAPMYTKTGQKIINDAAAGKSAPRSLVPNPAQGIVRGLADENSQ